jgi:hypothetical protein
MDTFNYQEYLKNNPLMEMASLTEDYYIHNESDDFEEVYTVKSRGSDKMAKSFPSYKEAVDYLNTLQENVEEGTTTLNGAPTFTPKEKIAFYDNMDLVLKGLNSLEELVNSIYGLDSDEKSEINQIKNTTINQLNTFLKKI